MSLLDGLRHRLRVLLRGGRYTHEQQAELHFHLATEAMHGTHAGAAPDDAQYAARRRLGNVTAVREEMRRAAGIERFDRLRQDLTYAVRQLSRSPGFTIAVVLTLAFGIGANATMFAIVDRVLLRAPEGIADADRLVQLRSSHTLRSGKTRTQVSMSYPSYVEFRAMTDLFDRVTAIRGPTLVPIDRGADATRAQGSLVADDYFATLGVQPALGRFFTRDETHETGGAQVVVLGYGYWQRRFGGSRGALGETLIIANNRYTVIGVAPRGFAGNTLVATDLWIPIASAEGLRFGGANWALQRGATWLTVIARLRNGTTPERARAHATVAWTAWNVPSSRGVLDAQARVPALLLSSLVPGRSDARPEHEVAKLLAGVSLIVLAIACANVANLLLARALRRRRETAIRLALGVSRHRLIAMFLIDGLILGALGGAVALLVAYLGVPLVRTALFAGTAMAEWSLDRRLLAFTAFTALAAGTLSGILPALQASRPSLAGALREGAREGAVHRSRTRVALLVVQGALSVVLLAGTGLFVRSLQHIGALPLGLDLDRVIIAEVQRGGNGHTAEQTRALYDTMRERVRTLPGVESASLSVGVPFRGQYALPLTLPGHDSLPGMGRGWAPFLYAVTDDFLRTMGTRIVRGRGLEPADERGPLVAVVSTEMARVFWPGKDAIGQCFHIDEREMTAGCTQVIGVAEDARRETLLDPSTPMQYYLSLGQAPQMMRGDITLVIRAANPELIAPLASAIHHEVQSLRPDLPFVNVRALADVVAPELRPWRLGATMFGLFGALALLIAAIGTYSVMHFSVAQRFHELGVRIALGARRGDILRLVVGQALGVTIVAGAVGLAIVLAGGRLLRDLLFQTSPHDPIVLLVVAAVPFAVAALASFLPAWRATRVDPVTALRAD